MSEAITDRIECENSTIFPKIKRRLERLARRFMLARELSVLNQIPEHCVSRKEIDRRMAEIRKLMEKMP